MGGWTCGTLGRHPCTNCIVWKRCRDWALPVYTCRPLLSCIIPTLVAYFLACHSYTSFYISNVFSYLLVVYRQAEIWIWNSCGKVVSAALAWALVWARPRSFTVCSSCNPVNNAQWSPGINFGINVAITHFLKLLLKGVWTIYTGKWNLVEMLIFYNQAISTSWFRGDNGLLTSVF